MQTTSGELSFGNATRATSPAASRRLIGKGNGPRWEKGEERRTMAASPHTRLTRTCRHPVYRGTIALQRWRFGFCTRTTANEPSAFGGKLTLPGLPQPCGFALGLGVRSTECLDEHKNRPRVDHECARWSPSAAQASTLRRDPQVLNVSGSFACSFLGIAASVDRQCFDEGRPAMNTALAARARALAADVSCSVEASENPGAQLPAGVAD